MSRPFLCVYSRIKLKLAQHAANMARASGAQVILISKQRTVSPLPHTEFSMPLLSAGGEEEEGRRI